MKIAELLRLFVRPAAAHCDTEDGPAVTDGRRALETGNVNIALRWVHESQEREVREAFLDRPPRHRHLPGSVLTVVAVAPVKAKLADRCWLLLS